MREHDAVLLERGAQRVVPAGVEIAHLLARHLVDRGERLGRGHAVGLARGDARLRLLAQTGDADLEELGEVRIHDRQELHALEQRIAGVLRLLEDAAIEREPGELAIQEPLGARAAGLHAPPIIVQTSRRA